MHTIKPVGVILSPFQNIEDMPIQPKGAVGTKGQVQVDAASDKDVAKKRSDSRFK